MRKSWRASPTASHFSFHDPDDGWHAVIWVKPGAAETGLKRLPEWKMIELD